MLKMHDATVKIHDRHRGGVVQEKKFTAPDACPKRPLIQADNSIHAYIRSKQVDDWLRGELGIAKPKR
jgi:hypothetical protein